MNVLLRWSPLALLMPLVVACTSHVETGGTGGGGGGASCPAPSPGLCPPSFTCVDGFQRTGQASCEDGQWVCGEVACDTDAGACDGSLNEYCSGGQIASYCCPAGAPCADSMFCDLGGGACVADTTCSDVDDGGAPPCSGAIDASDYDQSCTTDADCVAVYTGSVCGGCFCPNGAVGSKGFAAYQTDWNAYGPPASVCFCPLLPTPVCTGGVCTM